MGYAVFGVSVRFWATVSNALGSHGCMMGIKGRLLVIIMMYYIIYNGSRQIAVWNIGNRVME